jgi:hypothetical protein
MINKSYSIISHIKLQKEAMEGTCMYSNFFYFICLCTGITVCVIVIPFLLLFLKNDETPVKPPASGSDEKQEDKPKYKILLFKNENTQSQPPA